MVDLLTYESMLHGLLDAATEESIWLFDRDGHILLANPTALRRFGKSPAEVIGRPMSHILPPEVYQRRIFRIRRVFDSAEPDVFEDERGGIEFRHSLCPIKDMDGRVTSVAVFSRDITAQKKMVESEEALRSLEERYAKAFATNPAAIVITRFDDGVFLDVNDTWVELMGYSREEAIGNSARNMNIWPCCDDIGRFISELAEKGALRDWEQEFLKKSGEVFVAQLSAQVLTVAGETLILSTFLDITHHKRIEKALRESETKYKGLFDAIDEGFVLAHVIFDGLGRVEDIYYVEANAAAARHLGQDWTGKYLSKIAPNFERYWYALFGEVARTGESVRLERYAAPMGKWFEFCLFKFGGEQSRLVGGTFLDITERKRTEEELQKAHTELEARVANRTALLENTVNELHEKEHMLVEQSRMAAMGEMISNIAHQWRQPLNTLGLLVQKLSLYNDRGLMSGEVVDDVVQKSMTLINHMSGTIDDFRNFFKPEKEKVLFRLSEVVGGALKLIEAAFTSHDISIVIHREDDPEVFGYPTEYAQVVLNILNNAKDAFLSRRIRNPELVLVMGRQAGKSVLSISDNAGGIPWENISKIFEPHFTTKGTHGTGIGLFMSKNIIEKNMNGRLSVRNTAVGAQFIIEV